MARMKSCCFLFEELVYSRLKSERGRGESTSLKGPSSPADSTTIVGKRLPTACHRRDCNKLRKPY